MASLGDINNIDILIKTIADTKGIVETEGALGGLSDKAALTGKVLLGTAAAATLIGVASVDMAMKFQSKMELIRTQAGASQAEVDSMSKSVLALAKSSEFGPDKLSDALYHLESVGLRGVDAMKALRAASDAASVGHANLESVTNALAGALKSGIKGTEDMQTTMATLNAIVGAGNMRMDDLASAMGTGFLPAAKNFGISITDAGAALAELTRTGSGADESATRLRMTFALLAAPSSRAAAVFSEIGLKQNQLALEMRQKGLIPALQDLREHLIKTYGTTEEGKTRIADALSHAFGGGRSSAAILTLIQNLDDLKNTYTTVQDGTKNFADDVAARHAELDYKLKALWTSLQSTLISVGTVLIPFAAKALDILTISAGKVGKAFDWKSDFDKSGKIVKDFWEELKKVADRVEDYLKPKLKDLGKALEGLYGPVKKFVEEYIWPLVKVLGPAVGAGLVWAIGLAIGILKDLIKIATPVFQFLDDHKGVVIALAVTFGTLAAAMALGAAFDAITVGMATLQLVAIPSLMTTLGTLGGAFVAAFPVLAIGAAIGIITNKFLDLKKTVEETNKALQSLDTSTDNAIKTIQQSVKEGKLSKTKGQAMILSLGNDNNSGNGNAPGGNFFSRALGFASGGYTGKGSSDEIAGVVHKGEFVVPSNQVDQRRGEPKLVSNGSGMVINQTNNIYNQVDMAMANRELGWRLANA